MWYIRRSRHLRNDLDALVTRDISAKSDRNGQGAVDAKGLGGESFGAARIPKAAPPTSADLPRTTWATRSKAELTGPKMTQVCSEGGRSELIDGAVDCDNQNFRKGQARPP